MTEAIIAAVVELFQLAAQLIANARHAKDEEHAAIMAKVQASIAALKGDRAFAEQDIPAAIGAVQAHLDAIKKRLAGT